MNTIEDFKNAPVGATATRKVTGNRAMKRDPGASRWVTLEGNYLSDVEMMRWGYTLDPTAPTTAREALELAWGLAHKVKKGQVIPVGTEFISAMSEIETVYGMAPRDQVADALDELLTRTLEPLPDPEPDWLDAPAVIAWSRWDDLRREKVWTKADECYKSADGEIIDWSELRNVTPLYPKGQGGLNPSKSRGIEHEEYLPLLEKAWDEGFADGVNHDLGDWENAPSAINNPYRKDKTHE